MALHTRYRNNNLSNKCVKFKKFRTKRSYSKEKVMKHNSSSTIQCEKKMFQANTHINDGDAESAFHSITEGVELIYNRQKLVKLADSSKNVWRTVQEYTQYELAENEEDEIRIFKAELRTERKMREERESNAEPDPIQQTRTNQHRRDQINLHVLTATRSQGHVVSVVFPGIGHGFSAAKRKQR